MGAVHTSYGPGEIVSTETMHGRTRHLVAGNGFRVWVDATQVRTAEAEEGLFSYQFGPHRQRDDDDQVWPYLMEAANTTIEPATDVMDNSTTLPYDPSPQYPTEIWSQDANIQPGEQEIDKDQRLSPSDSRSLNRRKPSHPYPGPDPSLFVKGGGGSTEDSEEGQESDLGPKYATWMLSQPEGDDPVSRFRRDPVAEIQRRGYLMASEHEDAHMADYGRLIEADKQLRQAAWADVRKKAVRLRREGRVHVKDLGTDRIYATVEGDHGTYEVMIAKSGALGGQSVSNWHCSCFLPDAPIMLADGSERPISEIKPGDEVITHTGAIRRVVDVRPKPFDGEIVRVKAVGSYRELVATAEHKIWTEQGGERGWHEIGSLSQGDYLSQSILVDEQPVIVSIPRRPGHVSKNKYGARGVNRHPGHHGNERWTFTYKDGGRGGRPHTAYFHTKEEAVAASERHHAERAFIDVKIDTDLAYWLGWYTAEGCLVKHPGGYRVSFTVGLDERWVVEQLDEIAWNKFGVRGTIRELPSRGVIDYRVSNHTLYRLAEMMVGSGSHEKKLSAGMLTLPAAERQRFLDGWLYGDGCISRNGQNVISTVSQNLAHQARELLVRDGWKVGISLQKNVPGGLPTTQQAREIFRVSWSTQKDTVRQFQADNNMWHRIETVTREPYQGEVWDIEVKGDHSFRAFGWNVSNCEWGNWAFRRRLSYIGRLCFLPGTKVTMADGTLKPIEDIQAGDLVRSHTGEARKVTSLVINHHDDTVYGIHPRGHETVWTTGEHPFYVRPHTDIKCQDCWDKGYQRSQCAAQGTNGHDHKNKVGEKFNPAWVEAKDLNTKYWMSKTAPKIAERHVIFDLTEFCEDYREDDKGRILRGKPTPQTGMRYRGSPVNRYVKLDDDLAYLFGLYLGDGSHPRQGTVGFHFGLDEQHLVDEVTRIAGEKFGLIPQVHVARSGRNIIDVFLTSAIVTEFFHRYLGTGHAVKKLSPEVMEVPAGVLSHVLRGWIDSDNATSVNRNLVFQMEQIALRNGISSSVTVTPASKQANGLVGTNTRDIYHLNCSPNRDQKSQFFTNFVEGDTAWVRIQDVSTQHYHGPVFNLSVEVDETYQVNGFNTHNCSHGYATYLEMQSAHTKENPEQYFRKPRRRISSITDEFKTYVDDNNFGHVDRDAADNFISLPDRDEPLTAGEAAKVYDYADGHPRTVEERDFDVPYTQDHYEVYKHGAIDKEDEKLLRTEPHSLTPDLRVVEHDDDTSEFVDVEKDERETTAPDKIVHFSHVDAAGNGYNPQSFWRLGQDDDEKLFGTTDENLFGGSAVPGGTSAPPNMVGDAASGPSWGQSEPPATPLGAPGGSTENETSGAGDYTVQQGDTLWDIAGEQLGDPNRYTEIAEANPDITDPGLITPDQQLTIPGAGDAGDADSSTNTTSLFGPALGPSTSDTSPLIGPGAAGPEPTSDSMFGGGASGPAKKSHRIAQEELPAEEDKTGGGLGGGGATGTSDAGDSIAEGSQAVAEGTQAPEPPAPVAPATPGTPTKDEEGYNQGLDLGGGGIDPAMISEFAYPVADMVGQIGAPIAEGVGSGIANALSGGGLSFLGATSRIADDDLLNRLRSLSSECNEENAGHMDSHNREISEIVDELHDRGYDANRLVASIRRQADGAFLGEGGPDWADLPFAGTGPDPKSWYGTSEDYVNKNEKDKRQDVTDLGDDSIIKYTKDKPQQKASAVANDVVRQFHASGGGALANDTSNGVGHFSDDAIAGRAQSFLKTAGRVYSLAEQEALMKESHPLGARNKPDEDDLAGTHYLM